MHNDDDLDLLLNEALTTYAEPAIGLEQRILDHIEETGNRVVPFEAAPLAGLGRSSSPGSLHPSVLCSA